MTLSSKQIRSTTMRIGLTINYVGDFRDMVDELVDYEAAGLEIVFVPEAYSFDAVSQLGFIAARTNRLQIASAVLPLYTRTPALLAMTAAGLDYVSGGRFTLGIGTSGPQVVEGFHGVPFDAPLGRTREVVEICRKVWRRERAQYDGKYYRLPLPADHGTGLGKPLQLINQPVRERIPIVIGAVGPANVAVTAEIADGWKPVFYVPEFADAVWGSSLRKGHSRRDSALGALDIITQTYLTINDDKATIANAMDGARPLLARYIGGMGAKGKNFYHSLACRYGYQAAADTVQDLYLAGRRADAEAAVPADLIRQTQLIGSRAEVAERLAAFAASGVTTVNVTPKAPTRQERVGLIETTREMVEQL